MRWLLLLLIVCGCASRQATLRSKMAEMVRTPIPAGGQSEALPVQPFWLIWDNHNDSETSKYIITDIWSTTNILTEFTHKLFVPQGTNRVMLMPTNYMDFFIARFAMTNVGEGLPWVFSEWNIKSP